MSSTNEGLFTVPIRAIPDDQFLLPFPPWGRGKLTIDLRTMLNAGAFLLVSRGTESTMISHVLQSTCSASVLLLLRVYTVVSERLSGDAAVQHAKRANNVT